MILKTKKCVFILVFLTIIVFGITECKRGGGRRSSSSRGSSSGWGRSKQTHVSSTNYEQYGRKSKSQSSSSDTTNQKPSAPPAPKVEEPVQKSSVGSSSSGFIQNEKKQATQVGTSNVQQQPQRPIGWDVGQNSKPSGDLNKNHQSAPIYPQQSYPSQSYPNSGSSNYYGSGTNYNYGNSYQQPQHYPNYQQSGYSYNPNYQQSGYSYNPNMGYPQNYNNLNGYGQAPMYGNSYGGGGMFNNMFGGNKYGSNGFGGYGGLGGWGGHTVGGYGKRFGGGFGSGFAKHAFRNVMIGLLVWNLVSGFTRRPYYVYNYYNNPEKVPEEIPLPANAIIMCPENVTTLCAPNTAPLCTTNSTIMCVVLAQETVPCGENSNLKCVNSTVTCADGDGDGCDSGDKNKNASSSVQIPCVTNATINGKVLDNTTIQFTGTGTLLDKNHMGDMTTLCVTTLALPQPEDEANRGVVPLCSTENANTTCMTNDASKGLNSETNSTFIIQGNSTVQPLTM